MNKNIIMMVAAVVATNSITAPIWSMSLSRSYEKNLGDSDNGKAIKIQAIRVSKKSHIHQQLDTLMADPSDNTQIQLLEQLCKEQQERSPGGLQIIGDVRKYNLNEIDPKTGLSPLQTAIKMHKQALYNVNNSKATLGSDLSKQNANTLLNASKIVQILHKNGARRTVAEKFKDLPELHQQAIMLGLFGLFWTTASITNLEGFGLYSKVFLLIYIGACTYVIDYKYFLDQTP